MNCDKLDALYLKSILEILLDANLGTYSYPNGFTRRAIAIGNPPSDIRVQGLEVILPMFPDTKNMGYSNTIVRCAEWEITLVMRDGCTPQDFIEATEQLSRTFVKSYGSFVPESSIVSSYAQYIFRFDHVDLHQPELVTRARLARQINSLIFDKGRSIDGVIASVALLNAAIINDFGFTVQSANTNLLPPPRAFINDLGVSSINVVPGILLPNLAAIVDSGNSVYDLLPSILLAPTGLITDVGDSISNINVQLELAKTGNIIDNGSVVDNVIAELLLIAAALINDSGSTLQSISGVIIPPPNGLIDDQGNALLSLASLVVAPPTGEIDDFGGLISIVNSTLEPAPTAQILTFGSVNQSVDGNTGVNRLYNLYPFDAGYSMRQLNNSATHAIRVRRSSDNAELDIGFDDGDLDTSSLLAFVGSGNGFVTAWYDQSGNGRHLTQSTATRQPSLVVNGVIRTLPNGTIGFRTTEPGLETLDNQTIPFNLTMNQANLAFFGVNSKFRIESRSTAARVYGLSIFGGITPSTQIQMNIDEYSVRHMNGNKIWDSNINLNQTHLLTYEKTPSMTQYNQTRGYLDSSLQTLKSSNSTTFDSTPRDYYLHLCDRRDMSLQRYSPDAYFAELLVYTTNIGSDRAAIETNINDYYDIY